MPRSRIVVLAALGMALAAGCAHTGARFKTPLVPRAVLFGNPDRASPRLSPDGTRMAYLAPSDGTLNVWVGPVEALDQAVAVTHDTHRGIRRYRWAYTNRHIVYLQDKDGDENWRVFSVDLDTGKTLDLTPAAGVAARIEHVSPKFPEEILVGLNDRDPKYHDLYRVNVRTGDKELVLTNERFSGFVANDDFEPKLAMQTTSDGGNEIQRRTDAGWEPLLLIKPEDALTTAPIGFDKTGGVLYLRDSRERNTGALVALDLETGEQTVMAANDRVDISGVLRHPTEKTVQAVGFDYLRRQWNFFDLRVAADFQVLGSVAAGDIDLVSRSLNDDHWVIAFTMDDGPVRYYHYDRNARHARFLFTDRSNLEDATLARMHPIEIPARDGLSLVSYLTLPAGTDPDGDGRPDRPLPMVLLVHGGPWARDAWGLDPYHQWLANRGYAVLSVNFRGSTGFGKAFVNAGDLEWARKMHDDLIDAVDWAVAESIAQRRKVAIMGGSYGGYAALVGLTFTPEVFACGVDIVGPSNLITLMESIPPYWTPMLDFFTARVGDHRTDAGRALLTARSPLTHVDRICRPLLIGQGANDPRVKQAESDQIVAAMQERGIPVTYVLYPDEGHGFRRPENNLSFNAVVESFLAEHLNGRSEPVGADFDGASVTVPHGAKHVDGLRQALAKQAAPTPNVSE